MRIFLILFLLAGIARGQNIDQIVDAKIKNSEARQKAYTDSLFRSVKPGAQNPPNSLPKCDYGPIPEKVLKITTTSAVVVWNGLGVHGWDYSIYRGAERVAFQSVEEPTSSEPITYPGLAPGVYTLSLQANTCKSDVHSIEFVVPEPTGGVVVPDTGKEPRSSKTLGVTTRKVGGRTYTFQESPRLVLRFNQDGTFSDVTEGLDVSAEVHRLNGRTVFYAIDYGIIRNTDTGGYVGLQNFYLPDGVYTVRQFACDAGRIPDIATFVSKFNGWGENGVNSDNVELSEVMITITSDQKQGVGIVPRWLVASRALNFPANVPVMDWSVYNKSFSTGYVNKGDKQAVYQKVGVQPYIDLGNMQPQPDVWHTVMVGSNNVPDNAGLYGLGRHFMERMGSDPRSVFTSELGENAQGADPDIYGRVQLTYKGAFDVLSERYPGISPMQTGLFGDYGADDYTGFFSGEVLYGVRDDFEKTLTPPWLYRGYGVYGFGSADHEFYTRNHIGVRNLNAKYYLWNKAYNLPLEFAYLNEKTKLGTKTWQGKEQERKFSIFTMDKVESFVMNPQGQKINVEQSRTGEIIHFAEGDILTKMNAQPPAPAGEMFTLGFWGMVLSGGIQIWDAPGSSFGRDTTKLHWWSDQYIGWRKKGEKTFGPYTSGENGAPLNSADGLTHSMFASAVDAAAAGAEAAWYIRDRIQTLSYTSYSSERGVFTVKPGSTGNHLNGFGALNWNQFTTRDIADQKKGLAIIGEGPGGTVLIYYNGFLSPHESEEVSIEYNGQKYSLGRVYGRQTTYRKL